jgi:CRP-like cAMP-binding protein
MAVPPLRDHVQQNRLLRALSQPMLERLLPQLELVTLGLKDLLVVRDEPIPFVYFPLAGVVSLVSTLVDGATVEVATIGNEGLVGLSRFLRADSMPFTALVQVPGSGFRLEAEAFDRLLDETPSEFSQLLHRYTQALFNQIAQHVACNRTHPIAQRCVRWLLLTHDRVGRTEFLLTQEFLGQMLGVRRASVTAVAGRLQQAGLIRYRRGIIHTLDRAGLEAASCECYSVIKQEYDRLLGPAGGIAG